MTTLALPTLFIGDADRDEFRQAAAWLIDRGAVAASDVAAAQAVVREGFAPALIVVAQSWPGRFSERQIDELRRCAPLARIVRLLGTWLEGEGRTGKPWQTTIRTHWHQWQSRHARQLEQAEAAKLATWSLPVTAGEDDRLLAVCDAGDSNSSNPASVPLIAIDARTRESAESLFDLCTQRGWRAIRLRSADSAPPSNVDCAVFDADSASAAEDEAWTALRAALGDTPIIALVGFPRIEDLERFQTAGAAAIVAKPYFADELLWQIEQFLPQSAGKLH